MKYLHYTYLLILLVSYACSPKESSQLNSKQTDYSAKVDSLLAKMTLEEKIGQLNQYSLGSEFTGPGQKSKSDSLKYAQLVSGGVGSVLNLLGAEDTRKMQKLVVEQSRLGIPLLFAYDVIHGYKTMFPIPLAESCSWNLDLMKKTAAAAAHESTAAGLHWTFAPMMDVGRDARWGRVMEGAGEDPYLQTQIAVARINGFQGDNLLEENTIAATAKHFAGYGFVEGGKDYNTVTVNNSVLYNQILPPFKAAAKANVATYMNAFNDINAVPATANKHLMQDILFGKWNYDGLIVSDWNSIGELVNHRVAVDLQEAAKMAINAGNTIDMEGTAYIKHLKNLVENGQVSTKTLDEAVRKVLTLKYKLGLFDDPYRYSDQQKEKEVLDGNLYDSLALEIAEESIVLLKNENNMLPLKGSEKIAVIGPLGNDKDAPIGNWRAQAPANSATSLLEGLREKFGSERISFAEGVKLNVGANNFFEKSTINETDKSGFNEALKLASNAEVVIMALGETAYLSGEARSRASVEFAGLQQELLEEIYKVNQNIVLVLMNGRPLAINWTSNNVPAIVEAWHLGKFAGNAIANVIDGSVNPSGKITMSFPRIDGQSAVYYNHKTTGRPSTDPGMVFYSHYNDVENTALYPFGFGLSYSDFNYSEPQLNTTTISDAESINVKVSVTNQSTIDGEEIVQVYLRDEVAEESPVVRRLIDFDKKMIPAGQTVEFEFEVPFKKLGYYKSNGDFVIEKGDFTIFVGPNSTTANSAKFSY